ncbi:MAG TPA: glycosyltransferase [Egicoccus sp.]|nr:glycosyltransferase [Egicoccus sp.]HSK21705.1 glycosyltransferase [Egicoccus sp.]
MTGRGSPHADAPGTEAAAVTAAPRALPSRRVLLFANSIAVGGAETQLVRLATGLAGRGHDVTVAVLLDLPGWEAALAAAGVHLVRLRVEDRRHAAAGLVRAVALARRWRPDAVIGFDFQSSMVARLVGLLGRVPVVVSSIRNEHLGGGRARPFVVRLTEPLTTVTTTNSHRVARSLVDRRLTRADRVRVVHNGIDVGTIARPELVRRRTRRTLGVPSETFVWLAVAHLRPTKSLTTLFTAAEQLVADAPGDLRLFVAGGGAQLLELTAHPAVARSDRLITLLGARDDVPELLAAADGFVLSSTAEGLPNAIMEAMAAGLPVVSTGVGGVAELLEDGAHGRIVAPEDPAALAEAMRQIMALPRSVRHAMGAAGRARVTERFGLSRMVVAWEAVLDDALAASRR